MEANDNLNKIVAWKIYNYLDNISSHCFQEDYVLFSHFLVKVIFFCMIFVIIELYEYCLKEGYADKNLIAKWKKQGYENLCCLRCIQCRDTNFGTNCICRVPKAKLEEVSSCFCYLLWKVILPNVRAIFAVIYTTVLLRYMLTAKLT